jgi:hypothetical protein
MRTLVASAGALSALHPSLGDRSVENESKGEEFGLSLLIRVLVALKRLLLGGR